MSNLKTIQLSISGRVQGVWFRSSAKEAAEQLGITGWIANELDRSVTVVAQGDKDVLEDFQDWCKEGSPGAKVEKVTIKNLPEAELYAGFKIRY